jgi:uncharacterized membrane protein YeiH
MPLRYDPALIAGFLVVLDLAGTFVFALSGAMTGVRHRLDLFGVLVLSFAAGNAGGLTRDLLLGVTPPPAISDWRYIAASLAAGLITFFHVPIIDRLRGSVLVLDAAGLALFAVSGTLKALAAGLNPAGAMLLGVLTGVGGSMLRDVLVSEIPAVLRGELYASAALAGTAVVVLGSLLRLPTALAAIAGASLCFVLRYLAIRRGWRLPVAEHPSRRADDREPPSR